MSAAAGWRRTALATLPVATLVGTILLWEVAIRVFGVREYLLPAPSSILIALTKDWRYLFEHLAITSFEVVLGLALSIVIGIGLGVLMVMLPVMESALYPLLVASQSIPKIAIAPLLVVWAGIGLLPKILVAFLIAFFPLVIATVAGLTSVEPEMLHLARSMGATPAKTLVKIRFPTALPQIFAGLKVAVTLAVVGALVGEFIQADRGLGYVMLVANGNFDTRLAFATFVLLSGLGVAMFLLVVAVERAVLPWHASQRAASGLTTM